MNIAVFASHNGSGLQAIIDACKSKRLDAKVCAVFSNNSGSYALQRARDNEIPAFHFSQKVISDPEALDREILDTLAKCDTDIIFLAGYLKKLSPSILRAYMFRIFNIHPSLLPKYGGKGMHGINIHKAVLAAGEAETGITIHQVNEKYDEGKIIAQRRVPVLACDTPESLAARVLEEEHVFIVETLDEIVTSYGLFDACRKGNIELAKRIIDKGIDPNRVIAHGWTPLLLAVEHGEVELVDFLLSNGADANYQPNGDFSRWTALHHAVHRYTDEDIHSINEEYEKNIWVIIELLLKKGALPDLKDKSGKSPMDYAKEYNCITLVELLNTSL